MKKHPPRLVLLVALGLFLVFSPIAPGHAATTEVVTNTNDSGAGSLRQALADVDAGGTISFSGIGLPAEIVLTTPLAISKNVTIEGPGASQLAISGGNLCRVLSINGVTVNLSGLSVKNGKANEAGGIYVNGGALAATSCDITNNNALGGGGGAVKGENAILSFTGCQISDNGSSPLGNGGAIYLHEGSLSMTDCDIARNRIAQDEFFTNYGGAIYLSSTAGDGALLNASLTRCRFSENLATYGGAIFADGADSLTATSCLFKDNEGGDRGGALYPRLVAQLTVDSCLFQGNLARNHGGAIYLHNSGMTMQNSTLEGNWAYVGAGLMSYGYGPTSPGVLLSNCTITDNTADNGFETGGFAAGIHNGGYCSLSLLNCTVALNEAVDQRSGIWNEGSLTLKNTIVAGNVGRDAQNYPESVSGASLTSLGYNLLGKIVNFGEGWQQTTDIVSEDLVSGDIFEGEAADNGGPAVGVEGATVPMLTLALKEGSPAVDSGSGTGLDGLAAVTADQRGVARPQGSGYDIGAFELEAAAGDDDDEDDDDDTPVSGGSGGCSAGPVGPALGLLLLPLGCLALKPRRKARS
jgi:predicted outer membrane repeat protein